MKTTLKSGCSIGANMTIIWCEIGEDSFVGAGSARPKYNQDTMWYGNPAIEIKVR